MFFVLTYVINFVIGVASSMVANRLSARLGLAPPAGAATGPKVSLPLPVKVSLYLVPLTVVTCLVLTEFRWLLPIWADALAVLAALAAGLVGIGLIGFVQAKYPSLVWPMAMMVSGLLALTIFFADRALPHYISIDCPANGVIGKSYTASGRVAGGMDDYIIYPFFCPQDGLNCTYQTVGPLGQDHSWTVTLDFTRESSAGFSIIVLATKDDLNLPHGGQITENHLNQIPGRRSSTCTVKVE